MKSTEKPSKTSDERAEKCDKFVKMADMLSLVVFMVVWTFYDIYIATAALMAMLIPVTLGAFLWYRSVPRMQILMLILLVVFGGLTLYLRDPVFIKIKPTIMLGAFAVLTFISVWVDKPVFKMMIPPQAFQSSLAEELMTPLIRSLTWRMGCMFLILAVMNEIVWRTQSEGFWVYYKFFGSMGITMAFFAAHIPWFKRRIREIENRENELREKAKSINMLGKALQKAAVKKPAPKE